MNIQEKIINRLVSVKSIVTIGMLILVSFLAIRGNITGEEIQKLFWVVIAFYFGTQAEKRTAAMSDEEYVVDPSNLSAEDLIKGIKEASDFSYGELADVATTLAKRNGENTYTEAIGFSTTGEDDQDEEE